MSDLLVVFLYSFVVVLAALAGGAVPLLPGTDGRRLEYFLAASAGVLLGVVGAHLMPEAFHEAGANAAWGVIAGFLFLLVIERFVLPHSLHSPHSADDTPAGISREISRETPRENSRETARERMRAEGAGLGAYVGLALHTITDGVALGAAMEDRRVAPYVLLAIVVHKIPSAFALSSLLVRAGRRPVTVLAASASLGLMVGLGTLGFRLTSAFAGLDAVAITPYAVAFSAGSFLHVAVTDLLPDLHRSGARKAGLLLALFVGLLVSLLLGGFVPEHGGALTH